MNTDNVNDLIRPKINSLKVDRDLLGIDILPQIYIKYTSVSSRFWPCAKNLLHNVNSKVLEV